jgi:hypothetical protein
MIDLVEQGARKVGGLGKLAAGLGISHQSFYSWKLIPPGRVLDFERLTGIARHVQRPDLYGSLPGASQGDGAGPDERTRPSDASGPAMEAAE